MPVEAKERQLPVATSPNLDDMKLPELKELAKQMGLRGISTLRKPELIATLQAAGSGGEARAGVTVERAARPVHIFSIEILSIELPRVRMRVCCSKGTYIRTLCQDVGEVLGCGACMESLLRTRVGEFALADAIKLSEVEAYVIAHRSDATETEELQLPFLQAVDTVFLKYESATVDGQFRKYLYNGNRLRPEMFLEEHESMRMAPVRVYDDEGAFFGIYEYQAEKEDYKPLKVFK